MGVSGGFGRGEKMKELTDWLSSARKRTFLLLAPDLNTQKKSLNMDITERWP